LILVMGFCPINYRVPSTGRLHLSITVRHRHGSLPRALDGTAEAPRSDYDSETHRGGSSAASAAIDTMVLITPWD
jgi:hypothetical protein